MAIIDITGKWTGVITYGEKYHEYNGRHLYFDADLELENGTLHGIAIDTGGVGVNEDPAAISGSVSENTISFIMRYTSLQYFHKGRTVTDKSQLGLPIHYTGMYDEKDETFKGHWEYRVKYKFFWLIPMTYVAGGTWSMKRK